MARTERGWLRETAAAHLHLLYEERNNHSHNFYEHFYFVQEAGELNI
jgi:hypothetical protein